MTSVFRLQERRITESGGSDNGLAAVN